MKKLEKRAIGDVKYIEGVAQGYAAVFNSQSEDLGFIETISPDAITNDTLSRSDIFAVIDHNRDKGVLARNRFGKGSLELSLDSKGLYYKFKIADTPIGKELESHLERGEIDSSSFAFTVKKDEWNKVGDTYYRTILEIDQIYDVSPVFTPAYADTSVALRSLDKYKQSEEIDMNELEKLKEEIEELKLRLKREESEEEKIEGTSEEELEKLEEANEDEKNDEERDEEELDELEKEEERLYKLNNYYSKFKKYLV